MKKLGEFLQIKHGWAFKGEYFSDQGLQSILTPGNFFEKGGFKHNPDNERFYTAPYPKEYLCKKGDLVVAMTQQAAGLLGSTAIVPEDNRYLHNQRIGLVLCDETKLLRLYAYYLFMTRSVREQIERTASGTKVKHTSPEKIYDVSVIIPDISTQEKVSRVLWTIDCTIENNNKSCAELESIAKTIYDYWFVQFDFPNAEGKPYRTSGGKMVWNEQLKREIPEKWEVNDILDLCEIIDCLHSKKPTYQYESDDTFLLTLENLTQEGYIDLSTKFYIAKSDYAEWTSRIEVRENDFVVTNAGRAGDIGKIPKGVKCAIGRNLTAIRPFAIEPYYMRGFFKSGYVQQQILTNLDAGSFFKSFNVKSIKKLLVLVPDKKALNAYIELITPIVQMIESRLQETQQLRDLRDWLLPMLMNGQATVE